jgi:cytochrome c-type biogenesis protein CcmH
MTQSISSLKLQLQQLKELADSGVLPPEQYETSKALIERRILDLVLQGAPETAAVPSSPTPVGEALPNNTTRTSKGLLISLGLGVVVIAAAGYAWKGSPDLAQGNSASTSASASSNGSAENAPHTTNFDAIASMTDKLAARLKEQPADAEGWAMLARSYSVLSRHPEALTAYEKAVALRKDDATLLADYADSLAVANGGDINGKPIKQVERALQLEPRNIKALFLAGTHAFNRKDYKTAVKHWETATQAGPASNPFIQQIETSLSEARSLAGLPAPAPTKDATPASPSQSNASVSGTVRLSAPLQKQVQLEDTVFIYARPSEGSRMPLAILRKQVRDLPIEFKLDDSLAMSPANALSTVKRVIVEARISKTGNAMAQPGDLTGQSAIVAVGTSSIAIEIKETIKP